ncbi:hypothetical protein ACJX0J_020753 [Zea mays]
MDKVSEEDRYFFTAPFTETEFGFIKGRYILDGVKKQDGIILKIDFEKAEILVLKKLDILENMEGLWQKIVRNKGTLISRRAFWKLYDLSLDKEISVEKWELR